MIFDNAIPYTDLPESDETLKFFMNYNPQHNEYTRRQNIPERSPNETDRGGWRGYDRVYTKYMTSNKATVTNFLEIGVHYGYGLLAWSRWFDNAKIYGIDININPRQFLEITETREKFPEYGKTKIFLSDSTKEDMWIIFKENQFDVIIDDGDHHPTTQIKTLDCAWKYLKSSGLYFIEDVSHRYGENNLKLLSDKLVDISKNNKVSIYSHQNEGLKHFLKNLKNRTEYIIVIQKS